jgi:putative phage-type endonuclease
VTTAIHAAEQSGGPTARVLLPASATREEWSATRRAGIGGSDVAAILGLDKYRGPRHVYEAKHGRPDEVTSEAAEIGTEIEDFIARMFSKKSGVPIATPPGTLVHTEHSWMLANVDRYALWDEESGAVAGPVECKNRSEYQIDDWEDGVPDSPAIQCHWYQGRVVRACRGTTRRFRLRGSLLWYGETGGDRGGPGREV